jgi:hypothetical protein
MGIFKKGMGSKLSTLLALALWGFSMFLIYDKNYATSRAVELTDVPMNDAVSGEFQNWMNVTMGGAKIGYTMQSFSNSPLGYVLKDYSLIRLPMGGVVREIYLDSYAVLNIDFSLKNFTFGLISGDYTTDVFGQVRDGRLDIKFRSQNSESKLSFDAEKGVYLPSSIPLLASVRGFPEGEFQLPTFDPFSMAMNTIQVKIDSAAEMDSPGGRTEAHRLALDISGMASAMWVDQQGHVLREEEVGGMVMAATHKEDALNIPDVKPGGKDLLVDLAVPCQGEITDPRTVKRLRIQIDGVKPEILDLADDFQRIISTDPLVVEIEPGRPALSALTEPREFLKSEPFLQVDDPRIVARAFEIVGDERDRKIKANKLGSWVFENVEKDYSVSLPSAIDILEVRKGDCNEHTALYTALARASGIPTKICIGLVYKDGVFFYHAWPAVHVGGWQPIDPTFGQEIADASHIKLLEGGFERQADLMRVVGKIKVTVIEQFYEQNL